MTASLCPHCRKSIDASWTFCPFCGKSVTTPAPSPAPAAAQPIDAPVPDADKLSGPCTVIATQPFPADLSALGRAIAALINRPLADVTAGMHLSKGIVARNIDADLARKIRAEMAESGLPVLLIPEERILIPARHRLLRNVQVGSGQIQGEALGDAENETVKIPLANLELAAAVRIRSERRVDSTDLPPAQAKLKAEFERSILGRLAAPRFQFKSKKAETQPVIELSYQYAISLFTRNPLERYDVQDQSIDLDTLQTAPPDFERPVALAQSLLRDAPGPTCNRGIRLLNQGEREAGWEEITFLSRSGVWQYLDWLLQLAGRGLALPL